MIVESERLNDEDTKDVGELKGIDGMFEEVVDEKLLDWEIELGDFSRTMDCCSKFLLVLSSNFFSFESFSTSASKEAINWF